MARQTAPSGRWSSWVSEFEVTLNWFDYWLKSSDNDTKYLQAVNYYVMGDVNDAKAQGNQWRTSESWPINTTDSALYLRTDVPLSFHDLSTVQVTGCKYRNFRR